MWGNILRNLKKGVFFAGRILKKGMVFLGDGAEGIVLSVVVWPIAGIFSVPKLLKHIRDPEIRFFDSLSLSTDSNKKEIVRLKHLTHAKYKVHPDYLFYQFLSIVTSVIVPLFFFISDLYIKSRKGQVLIFTEQTNWYIRWLHLSYTSYAVGGLVVYINDNPSYKSALASIVDPLRFYFSKNPKHLHHDEILSSALISNTYRFDNEPFIDDLKRNFLQAQTIFQDTGLSAPLVRIILEYSHRYFSLLPPNRGNLNIEDLKKYSEEYFQISSLSSCTLNEALKVPALTWMQPRQKHEDECSEKEGNDEANNRVSQEIPR